MIGHLDVDTARLRRLECIQQHGLLEFVDRRVQRKVGILRCGDEGDQRLFEPARQPGQRRRNFAGIVVAEAADVSLARGGAAVEEHGGVRWQPVVLGLDLDRHAAIEAVEQVALFGVAAVRDDLVDRARARNHAIGVALAWLDRVIAPAELLQRRPRRGDVGIVRVARKPQQVRQPAPIAGFDVGALDGETQTAGPQSVGHIHRQQNVVRPRDHSQCQSVLGCPRTHVNSSNASSNRCHNRHWSIQRMVVLIHSSPTPTPFRLCS
jgi:hypothetical protein